MTRPERPLPSRGPHATRDIMTDDPTETSQRRRARLADELEFYLGRVAELVKLDPHDFTGLKRVYDEHVRRARAALAAGDG